MSTAQRPLELILARNLMTSLSTPAFLTEEVRSAGLTVWEQIGPFDRDGTHVPIDRLPLTIALRNGSPAHASVRIRTFDGIEHDIEVSALPIVSAEGPRGAMAFFWPIGVPS